MAALNLIFDSDVRIHALNGTATRKSRALLLSQGPLSISVVTWMEVMAGASPQTEESTRSFLARFVLCEIPHEVAEQAVNLRRTRKLRLRDAIIYATALVTDRTLVTHNTRD